MATEPPARRRLDLFEKETDGGVVRLCLAGDGLGLL